jgi:putative glutathione S-transferase
MDPNGWAFARIDPFPGAGDDPVYNAKYIKDIYLSVEPQYQGRWVDYCSTTSVTLFSYLALTRFTVPVLFDKKTQTIVNNESSEIIRIFNSAFNALLPEKNARLDFYPKTLQSEIDKINEWVYNGINSALYFFQRVSRHDSPIYISDGVYRAGFASTQSAYEQAYHGVFSALDRIEDIIAAQHSRDSSFLIGDQLTEADVRLYVTAIRFDVAYYGLFKCNKRDIRHGYPAIHRWLRNLYWNYPAFKDTTNFEHIKTGYSNVVLVNPNLIAPLGPDPHILPLDGAEA